MSSPTALAAVAAFRPLLAECEAFLAQAVAGYRRELADPAADTLAAGGKRIRPLLVFCCAPNEALHDRDRRAALVQAAAAVELVHMATLVHDDLLDDAGLRRGRPTVAAAHGPATAIGTGDFLFARAFGVLTETERPDAVRHLATAALGLSRGEMDQNQAAFDLDLSEGDYLARCRRKTGALFAVACRLGALIGGADAAAQENLATFGDHVGLAFQIFDDILDVAGSPEQTGKRRGTDLRDGTVTLPVIYALRHEPALRQAIGAAGSDADREALCDHLARHPGTAAARERALAYVSAARAAVEEGPTGGATTAALREIADGVVDRYA